MSAHPVFSVVIPLYNGAQFILRALQSVISQDLSAHEIIVVDDGSTDGGGALVASAFPQVVIVRQTNSGGGEARNAGVRRAAGPWIAFLDADDLWGRNHLRSLAEAIERSSEAVMAGSVSPRRLPAYLVPSDPQEAQRLVDERLSRRLPSERRIAIIDYLAASTGKRSIINSSSCAIRREMFTDFGAWFSSAPVHEDLEVWCRVALRGPLALVSTPTTVIVDRADGVSERHRLLTVSAQQRDCHAYKRRPHFAVVNEALESDGLPAHRQRVLERYLDGTLTRQWPTVLMRADQACARTALRDLHRPWAFSALPFRLAALTPNAAALVLAWLIRRLALVARFKEPLSPFAQPMTGSELPPPR